MTSTVQPRRLVRAFFDDDLTFLESLEMLRASAEYDWRLFSSAAALLERFCLMVIDCMITDIGMPVMDGFELARIVQAARPGVPVIFITGRPDLLNMAPRDVPGHYRLFKKPFNGPELLTTVGDALRGPHMRTPGS